MTYFSLVYAGAAEVLPIVDFDLRRSAVRVSDSAKQLCSLQFALRNPYFYICFQLSIPCFSIGHEL
jgi:hypothetical protein